MAALPAHAATAASCAARVRPSVPPFRSVPLATARKQDGARLFADTSAVDINTRVEEKGEEDKKEQCRKTVTDDRAVGATVVVIAPHPVRGRRQRRHAPRDTRLGVSPCSPCRVSCVPPSSSSSPSSSPRFPAVGGTAKPRGSYARRSRACLARDPVAELQEETVLASGAHLRNARSAAIPPAGRRIGSAARRERRVSARRKEL